MCVCIRGPLAPGSYPVGSAIIEVSYPTSLSNVLFNRSWVPPLRMSTFLVISWPEDDNRELEEARKHWGRTIGPAKFKALDFANRLFGAYKLAELNHLYTATIRTLGDTDVLYHRATLDGTEVSTQVSHCVFAQEEIADNSISRSAQEHISGETKPISRRIVRCFELAEHGYYTEALIVTVALLDDLVQDALQDLLQQKGLTIEQAKKDILGGIERERVRRYLGPLLKVLTGKSLEELWPASGKAMKWLNTRRNAVVHAGAAASRADAFLALYAVLRCLKSLEAHGSITLDFDQKMVNHAYWFAFQLAGPDQDWVPKQPVESD